MVVIVSGDATTTSTTYDGVDIHFLRRKKRRVHTTYTHTIDAADTLTLTHPLFLLHRSNVIFMSCESLL